MRIRDEYCADLRSASRGSPVSAVCGPRGCRYVDSDVVAPTVDMPETAQALPGSSLVSRSFLARFLLVSRSFLARFLLVPGMAVPAFRRCLRLHHIARWPCAVALLKALLSCRRERCWAPLELAEWMQMSLAGEELVQLAKTEPSLTLSLERKSTQKVCF